MTPMMTLKVQHSDMDASKIHYVHLWNSKWKRMRSAYNLLEPPTAGHLDPDSLVWDNAPSLARAPSIPMSSSLLPMSSAAGTAFLFGAMLK